MKMYRIMMFIVLFNLFATMMIGLGVFKWGITGQPTVLSGDYWKEQAGIMIAVGLVTGVFGLLSHSAASVTAGIFWSTAGVGLTVSTMNWLSLPWQVVAVVDGVVVMIAFFALMQILTGVDVD